NRVVHLGLSELIESRIIYPPCQFSIFISLIRTPFGVFNMFANTECFQCFRVHYSCIDRKSTRLNSSHVSTSYAVFCLQKKNRSPAASWVSARSWTTWLLPFLRDATRGRSGCPDTRRPCWCRPWRKRTTYSSLACSSLQ